MVLAALFLVPTAGAESPHSKASGSQDATPVAVEKLEINADEIAAGLPLRFGVDPDARPLAVMDSFEERYHSILDQEAEDISRLREQIANTHDAMQRLELAGRVADRRRQTELSLLRLQIDRARAAGREELARSLEAELQKALDPKPVERTKEIRTQGGER
jgi:hypothetical protein